MVVIKKGDLFDATENIICHQVNCFGTAGGLAHDMFNRFPDAAEEYYKSVDTYRGKVSTVQLLGTAQIVLCEDKTLVANVFGQYYPGFDYRPDAVEAGLREVAEYAKKHGLTVAVPYRFSCGIAGGDWNEVYQIIEEVMNDVHCVIYKRD